MEAGVYRSVPHAMSQKAWPINGLKLFAARARTSAGNGRIMRVMSDIDSIFGIAGKRAAPRLRAREAARGRPRPRTGTGGRKFLENNSRPWRCGGDRKRAPENPESVRSNVPARRRPQHPVPGGCVQKISAIQTIQFEERAMRLWANR